MKKTTVLVADDDPHILQMLRTALAAEGWNVLTAVDGVETLELAANEHIDIIILDIMMPRLDGFQVCLRLRENSNVPVIGLTCKTDWEDKVELLNLGADDYLTKPFRVEELIARINAVLRRNTTRVTTANRPPFKCKDLEINYASQTVRVEENTITLTPTEYRILEELTMNNGKTVTYRQLLEAVWGPDFREDRQYIHVHVSHLRHKIESENNGHKHIMSQPRVGYRFE